jgi:hypothetical protein
MNKVIELNQKEVAVVSGGVDTDKLKATAANAGSAALNIWRSVNNEPACRVFGTLAVSYLGFKYVLKVKYAIGYTIFGVGCAFVGDVAGSIGFALSKDEE